MQTAGGDDEACRIGQRIGAGRKLGAMRMAVEDRERADDERRRPTSGGRAASATTMPSTAAETAMPISTPGSGTPRMPSTPPNAITSGNTTGRM